jgi:hypothetical protein
MTTTILFVDSKVSDYEVLLASLADDVEVHVLNAGEDGVLQMADILKGRTGLDSIQILSHGSSGALALGSGVLNNDNLASYTDALKQMGSSLSETGDILLYGCNVAQGEAGLQFIDQLSKLTDADVAASTDLTGAASQGGDWNLEAATGVIESPVINATESYQGLLVANFAPTFVVGNGKVITPVSSGDDIGRSVIQQADGKLVVAGYSLMTGADFVLTRYNSDGSLDIAKAV